jgi:hypothetical protein
LGMAGGPPAIIGGGSRSRRVRRGGIIDGAAPMMQIF